jgi:hypothetical protein
LKISATISKMLSFLGLAINVIDIILDPNLDWGQKFLSIMTHILATIIAGKLSVAVAGTFYFLPGVLVAIITGIAMALLVMFIVDLIENYAYFSRKKIIYT